MNGHALRLGAPTVSPPRILIADDAPTVGLLVTRTLEALGWDVVTVTDGVAAYEEGSRGDFDLAVLDHFMPGMSSAEILARWKREGVGIPVIVLSGLDDPESIVDLLELGAVDFLRKPFNPRELAARVRIHLGI